MYVYAVIDLWYTYCMPHFTVLSFTNVLQEAFDHTEHAVYHLETLSVMFNDINALQVIIAKALGYTFNEGLVKLMLVNF